MSQQENIYKTHMTQVIATVLDEQKKAILKKWLDNAVVSEIFVRYDVDKTIFERDLADGFFNAVMGKIRFDTPVTTDQNFNDMVAVFVCSKSLRRHELVFLFDALKNAMLAALYSAQILSMRIAADISDTFLHMTKDVVDQTTTAKNSLFKDTFEREKQKNLLLLNEYKKAVDESNIVSKTNPKGIISYVNKQFCRISGYTADELLGKPHNIIRHPDMPKEAFRKMWETIKSKNVWHGTVKNLKKDGSSYIVDTTIVPILDLDGDIVEYIAIRHDITELESAKEQLKTLNYAMKKKVNELYGMTQNLEQQATTDILTGIFNRYKFDEMLEIEIKRARLNEAPLSLILFDIDHFKAINDTFGHQAGDKALIEVARIASENIKRADIIARWGGEEFTILAINTDLHGAMALAEKLRKAVADETYEDISELTISLGVAELAGSDTPNSFLRHADQALYDAKKMGRNQTAAFAH